MVLTDLEQCFLVTPWYLSHVYTTISAPLTISFIPSSAAKSCKWVRTDFSHDLFVVCEDCVALACNNGITAGLKLEVPFLVSLSVVCPCHGDSACHPHGPSNSCVFQCTSWIALLSACTGKKAVWKDAKEGIFIKTAAQSGICLSYKWSYMIDNTSLHNEVVSSKMFCVISCHWKSFIYEVWIRVWLVDLLFEKCYYCQTALQSWNFYFSIYKAYLSHRSSVPT